YAEREQLLSGADAAATKAAQLCATDPAGCTATGTAAVAGRYADVNAGDGRSGVDAVCGRGGGLPGCPAPLAGVSACVNAAPGTGDYVEVRTSTVGADGSTLLPAAFAQAIVKGYRGTTVTACA